MTTTPTPQRFRKKPVVIEAMRFTTNNETGSPAMDAIVNWANQGKDVNQAWHNGTDIFISTMEGEMRAQVGDWIIRGVAGEFYPCKPDDFDATYQPADDTAATPCQEPTHHQKPGPHGHNETVPHNPGLSSDPCR